MKAKKATMAGLILNSSVLQSSFIRFCVVGGIGFIINAIVLSILFKSIGLPILPAQLASAEAALIVTFALHHTWTYAASAEVTWQRRLGTFHGTTWIGIVLNSLITSSLVTFGHINYLIGLAIASVIVLFWNYYWTRYHIWQSKVQK